jgi:type III restriction enzyme
MLSIKEYQSKAIDELVSKVSKLISDPNPRKVCIFQSPTGSGKTFMAAKFIEELILNLKAIDLCFLWVSIGKGDLHKQSKKSLDSIMQGSMKINLLEDEFNGSRTHIEQNEIVVVNWEKLYSKFQTGPQAGEWKNTVMKDGEAINFIEVMQNTKIQRKIILIIDESHYASDAERTSELRDIIDADVTLEMSATPKIIPTWQQISQGSAATVYVDSKSVIEAGMIKKELLINPNILDLIDDEKTSQDIIIEGAFNKRLSLKEAFSRINLNINPLCLIQLPNSDAGESKKESIEFFLESKGVTQENGKLAVWLSDEKSDHLDQISSFTSDVDFLIFKQAIDTGWDCPRAHILVKLRDIQSFTFEVQTVGRILRMPEQKHYDDESLNTGYIFTNLERIIVNKEEFNPNIIKTLRSSRIASYKNLDIESYYKSRVDYGDITASFTQILEKVFCEGFQLKLGEALINTLNNFKIIEGQGLVLDKGSYRELLISDSKISSTSFDEILGDLAALQNASANIKLSNNDLQDLFNKVIQENLNGFSPKRSTPNVRGAIYQWFKKYLGINYLADNGAIYIQYIFLNQKNRSKFTQLLSKATGEYKPIQKNEVKAKIEEFFYEWNIKKEDFFNEYTDIQMPYKLYAHLPCYLKNDRSNPEKNFELFLENRSDVIDWWYKNGEGKRDYLGIKYEENSFPMTFYPDYLIKLKTGKIIIGDTKSGITAAEAKNKAEALQLYVKNIKNKDKNLIGGIVIEDSTGKWRLNQNESYFYDKNDLTGWSYFEDILML